MTTLFKSVEAAREFRTVSFKNVHKFYSISEHGEVLNTKTGRIVKPSFSTHGYKQISLRTEDGKLTVKIHKLVAIHFIGECPADKTAINHIDGDKTNNHYSNLEWVTNKENSNHARLSGLLLGYSGENNNNAKLTEADIPIIAEMAKTQRSDDIAEIFKVNDRTIRDVLSGKTWKRVNPLYVSEGDEGVGL